MMAYWKAFKELWHANNFYLVYKITVILKCNLRRSLNEHFSTFKIIINPFLLLNSKSLLSLIDQIFDHVVMFPKLLFKTNLRLLHLKQAYVQGYELLLRAVLHFLKQFVVSRRMPKTQVPHPTFVRNHKLPKFLAFANIKHTFFKISNM